MDLFANISTPPSRLTPLGYGGVLDFKFPSSERVLLQRCGLVGCRFKAVELEASNAVCSLQQHFAGQMLQGKRNRFMAFGSEITHGELELRVDEHSPDVVKAFFNWLAASGRNVRTRMVIHQDRFTVYKPEGF